jgi:hypothetical protein
MTNSDAERIALSDIAAFKILRIRACVRLSTQEKVWGDCAFFGQTPYECAFWTFDEEW